MKAHRGSTTAAQLAENQALGDPSRFVLFESLRASTMPLRIDELTTLIPLHHNTIRGHLRVLERAGLVDRETIPSQGRGRPAHRYGLSAAARTRWSETNTHQELSLMLLDTLTSGESPRAVGQRAGRRLLARIEVSHVVPDPAREAILAVSTELGFEPTWEEDHIRLRSCPYAVPAAQSRDVVCALHLGISEATVDAVDPGRRVALEIHDPYAGRCRFTLDPPAARAS